MKITDAKRIEFMKQKLATNKHWAVKGMVRLYQESQTTAEQDAEAVHLHNDEGFTSTDAQILSSFSKQWLTREWLSEKQMAIVFKKMPKYARQILKTKTDVVKLDEMINKAELMEA